MAAAGMQNIDIAIKQMEPRPAAYVLFCHNGKFYTGSCRNLVERLKDHRAGRVSRTKNARPLLLAYHDYFENYSDALRREHYLKSGSGRNLIKELLKSS